jgi:hypothetical protein
MADLPEILWDVINAAAARDWERVLTKTENLKRWAIAAREAAGSHADEHPGNGPGPGKGR